MCPGGRPVSCPAAPVAMKKGRICLQNVYNTGDVRRHSWIYDDDIWHNGRDWLSAVPVTHWGRVPWKIAKKESENKIWGQLSHHWELKPCVRYNPNWRNAYRTEWALPPHSQSQGTYSKLTMVRSSLNCQKHFSTQHWSSTYDLSWVLSFYYPKKLYFSKKMITPLVPNLL